MKTLIAALVLATASLPAFADCAATSFGVEGFQVTPNPRERKISLAGKLVNKCSEPAAAQIRIVAKDGSGRVLDSEDGWPAGTANIPPGGSVNFDLGPLFRFNPEMADFSVAIIGVRKW
ncbi:hypothetical protein MBSD_n0559 [Mizugakiibacter sediminis]|uniref:DUF2141 domain-containing protein n=1 Tax=Mizugakiibacter sediminis TaxID=1475481 RepID=A0A0K8QK04_9GAMM|nr:hypothetical protein [Mizugakiibacter sediminis]GAP65270.1 hypothetical protein MBSD_n0559 [Mizugakiibacter sediminis]